MATLTISEASRACDVARTTIQRAVRAGRLALDPEHRVDISELLRAGFQVNAAVLHAARPQDGGATPQNAALPRSSMMQPDAAQQELLLLRREKDMLQQERDRLAQQVEVLLMLHQTTQQHLTQAQQMLHEAQQRYDRLLEVPRPSPPAGAPRPSPSGAIPGHSVPQAMPDTWQQILTYMQAHPGPQRPQDVQRALGRTQPARHVMHPMRTAGLLRRVSSGVYVLADTVREEGEA